MAHRESANKRRLGLAGLVGGVMLSLPALSANVFAAPNAASTLAQSSYPSAQQSSGSSPTYSSPYLNPCPSVYYEEPFNSTRIPPQGCPPNAASSGQGQSSQSSSSSGTMMPMGRPVAPSTAASTSINPCPAIYYEEPFNSTRIPPQGCPANAATSGQTTGQ
jgi:hypothetical protein